MQDELRPLDMLLLIVVQAVLVETPARRREAILARIRDGAGDPRVVPIHDGDALRMSIEVSSLLDRLLPSWLA